MADISQRLAPGAQWLFVAMAHWRHGRTDEAWLDGAVSGTDVARVATQRQSR